MSAVFVGNKYFLLFNEKMQVPLSPPPQKKRPRRAREEDNSILMSNTFEAISP
jgi:hypothetical protein